MPVSLKADQKKTAVTTAFKMKFALVGTSAFPESGQ